MFAIAEAIQLRYRLLVLLATFAPLRYGELVALRRNSINVETMELRVRHATAEMLDRSQVDVEPKSAAGKRPISLPHALRTDVVPAPHRESTWSAQSGTTMKELMARIGHSSTRAAMIYQHATRERDRAIAAVLDALIDAARGDAAGTVTG